MPRKDLSQQQERILQVIRRHLSEHGYPPSIREIGQAVGLRSSSTIHAHLLRLEKRGLIRRDPSKPRTIEVLGTEPASAAEVLPVLGRVAAGLPLLASENIEEEIAFPAQFLGPGRHFLLRVKGDSMVEAGIRDGDYLLVQERSDAANGEIVVAMVDGEATVKRLYRDEANRTIRLQPENPAYEPIVVSEATVIGRVRALLRRY